MNSSEYQQFMFLIIAHTYSYVHIRAFLFYHYVSQPYSYVIQMIDKSDDNKRPVV